MKNHITLLIFYSIFTSTIFAQNFSKEIGKISSEEYLMTSHTNDPDAEAVVLFDIGSSRFVGTNKGFDIVYERKTRIKIFSEAGLKWAEIQIPYYQEGNIYETIYELTATSYVYENGKIITTPLDLKNTYTEKINKSWNVRKFALPNIKPGSIIEYQYKINSQYIFQPRDWYFQWRIPVLYSEYNYTMIPFFEYIYVLQGTKTDEIEITTHENKMHEKYFGNVKYSDFTYKFVKQNIPAFKSEEFISTVDDYIAKINFQLSKINRPNGGSEEIMSTWEKLIDDLSKQDNFGKFINRSTKVAEKILNVNDLKTKTEQERFDHIIDYVKNNFLWNQINGIYASKTPSKLMEEKTGNAADINLFTLGLLNSVGIKSYPMIISTRPNGKIKMDYPFLNFFDYVVIVSTVNGRNLMADATDILAQNNRIPEKCINDVGLIIDKQKPLWINTEPQSPSLVTTHLKMEVTRPDQVVVELSKVLSEYDALRFKKLYVEKKEGIKETLERGNTSIIEGTLKIKDPLKRSRTQFYSYTCNYKPDFINGKIYISPFLHETLSQNPLKEKERSYPVDFTFKKSEQLDCKITIPKNYKVDYTPQNIDIDNDLFSLNYSTVTVDEVISVSLKYVLKKAIYPPEEYENLKSFLDELVKKSNEKIVLAAVTTQ